MSLTVADLKYLDSAQLYQWIKQNASSSGSKFLVVDVRDSDYVGGHIRGGLNVPSSTVKSQLEPLFNRLLENDVKDVVFHCALSQQRAPSSAMLFIRYLNQQNSDLTKGLKIWILKGGFVKWQEAYGEDDSVTEAYEKDIWRYGY
ncbi:Phosphatase [Komagataella phaffii CBS 7435]|uniref:Rhodanese domain-containing protein n=2 Tax=Komagataella phaffii TaxID=460519 RepID=C4R889_KOMPG|nr:Hypothetical protein PAS_chr4_0554 [Komagataella phaffii GS115]AOA64651.1 GQ67_04924T0 [Komagataella phaffii]CAH2450793.1 Phosphatase [Komagataella phaffii CBS 7435]AOA69955.1 GQ68_04896T0 [Komagataella phaffii GS115]CAY71814.1 Hypothetical protein PAS_chr4_0554 [Komagataella phaffii GS115]CCA40587.1 Phosphatase [Komagataella phaffii CBS 7435]